MSDVDPSDPFASLLRSPKGQPPSFDLTKLLAKPVESQPPLSLLESLLTKPAESLPPQKLAQIESLLRQSQTAPSPPEKSLLQKLTDHVKVGSGLVNEKKVSRANSLQWLVRLRNILQPLFGSASPYIKGLEDIRKRSASARIGIAEFSEITATASALAEFLASTGGVASGHAVSQPSRPPATKNVFVIHGHDELNARRLSDLLREHGLTPVVMRSQPGMSRVLTDKFEAEASSCTFALAIFTPDDLITSGTHQYHQARPNVIYETGWFIARLGKERVIILLRAGAEMHTDLQGVSRVQFGEDLLHSSHEIQRELRAAGLIA
jgi:predicted nucleotide-binding protein with TIR-like domain